MRVLLCYTCRRDGHREFFERLLPVGLCTLHATLRVNRHDSSLANFSEIPWKIVERQIRDLSPQVVGISTFTFNQRESIRMARLVKRTLPLTKVVLGGPHASHLAIPILEAVREVDYVVLGEAEETLLRLLDVLGRGEEPTELRGVARRHGGRAVSGGWPLAIDDLDRIPSAHQHFGGIGVNPREQLMYVITSRGCPGRCTFCSTPDFWGTRIRFRSVGHVATELRALRDVHGLLYVSFRDDTFTANRSRLLELCDRMREEHLYFLWDCQSRVNAVDDTRLVAMRRAGCLDVQYGVESGSSRVLAMLGKGIAIPQIESAARATRRAGLVFSIYLISGIEGETRGDRARTDSLLRRIKPHDAVISPLAIYPGTRLGEAWRHRHGHGEGIWLGMKPEDLVLSPDSRSRGDLLHLGRVMEEVSRTSAYSLQDYRAHRKTVGDCHALDLCEAAALASLGRPRDAEMILRALVRREPQNPWGHLRLGEMLYDGKKWSEAESCFSEAAALVPRSPLLHVRRAQAFARLGRRALARASCAAALRLDPNFAAARRTLKGLEKNGTVRHPAGSHRGGVS